MKNNNFRWITKCFCLIGYFFCAGLLQAQSSCTNDTVPPVARCNSDFSIEVFDTTIANEIPAKVFDNGSFDNCTSSDELHFAFSENPNDTIYGLPF